MMSDMAQLRVRNRNFQRSTAEWMRRARRGDTIVIVGPTGPPLTLTAAPPLTVAAVDWNEHFRWLEQQPVTDSNPVDEVRRAERR